MIASEVREKTRDDALNNTKTILLDYVLSICESSRDARSIGWFHFFLDIKLKASYKGDTSAYCCTGARNLMLRENYSMKNATKKKAVAKKKAPAKKKAVAKKKK